MAFGCKLPSPVFGISPEACFVVSRAFVYFISRLSSIPNLTFLLFFSSSPYFSLSFSSLFPFPVSSVLLYTCGLVYILLSFALKHPCRPAFIPSVDCATLLPAPVHFLPFRSFFFFFTFF